MSAPLLVIVGGAPGTGKTTLARELARRLHVAILAKDEIKEVLGDTLGVGDRARSRELGAAAYAVMWAVARRTLDADASIVVEANFSRDRSRDELHRLAVGTDAVIVLCRSDAATRRERFAARSDRHPVHLDTEILANEWPADDSAFDIDIGIPRLLVDTTNGYDPALDAITAWVSSKGGPRTSVRRPVD